MYKETHFDVTQARACHVEVTQHYYKEAHRKTLIDISITKQIMSILKLYTFCKF